MFHVFWIWTSDCSSIICCKDYHFSTKFCLSLSQKTLSIYVYISGSLFYCIDVYFNLNSNTTVILLRQLYNKSTNKLALIRFFFLVVLSILGIFCFHTNLQFLENLKILLTTSWKVLEADPSSIYSCHDFNPR